LFNVLKRIKNCRLVYKIMKNIAIFGFQDSLVGQVINFLPLKLKKKIKCIIILEKPRKNKKN